jgi:hypothetical protein
MTSSGTVPELPLAGLATAIMRRFVAETGRRRLVPTTVHVGVPLGECRSLPDAAWYDAGTRAALVARALEGIAAPGPWCLWLSRSGDLETDDRDLAWLAAARDGFGAHGLVPRAVFVVTRRGWADLGTGARHHWSRVRPVQDERGAP